MYISLVSSERSESALAPNNQNTSSCFQLLCWIDFSSDKPVDIHVFTDVSKLASGTVAYLSQGMKSILWSSKSKRAPLNKQSTTIYQVELSAMLLGAQVCASILPIHCKDFHDVHVCIWTDSKIALFWLSSTHRLKQFFQNTVDTISKLFNSTFWSHTTPQENPSELVSHGCSVQLLKQLDLWSSGPSWIPEPSLWSQWPISQPTQSMLLKAVVTEQVVPVPSHISNVIYQSHFTHYSHLLVTSVYVHIFCYCTGNQGPPSTDKFDLLEMDWIHSSEEEQYSQVIDYFTSMIKRASIIPQHNIFFPVIASAFSFYQLLVLDFHQPLHHVGGGGTIAALRQCFWIPSVCSLTHRLPRTCVTCKSDQNFVFTPFC